jgi:hypothetical protein
MVPSAIVFMDRLPLTPNGKLDRKALPAPEFGRAETENGYVGARTPAEEILAGIFGEVLRVDRVGIYDNFFEIGGHSLLATQVISRIRDVFGVGFGVRNIFERSTVESLANGIEAAIRAGEQEPEAPLQYWKERLGGKLPVVNLAGDHHHPLTPRDCGSTESLSLPSELLESLRTLIKREESTLLIVLLAAFKTLLYRYTAESDIVVGTALTDRRLTGTEHPIGFGAGLLPLRTDLSGNPLFTTLLKRVRDVVLGAYVYREIPVEKLVEDLQPERESGQTPLFNIVFAMQNEDRAEQQLAGVDLALSIFTGAETMRATWIYSADLFKKEAILHMHSHFETLLSSVVARPDASLDELEMSSEAERAQRAIDRAVRKENHYSRFKNVKPKRVILPEE